MTASPRDLQHNPGMSAAHYFLAAGRFVAGYILAVAVGAIVFAVIAHAVPDMPLLPDPIKDDPILSLWQTAFMYFIFGLIFGIPYTVLGSLAFWFLLRRSVWLLVLGTLCPAAAILLMFSMMGAIAVDGRMAKLLLVTLPAGLAATYIYGAIGFGLGFRRWRLA